MTGGESILRFQGWSRAARFMVAGSAMCFAAGCGDLLQEPDTGTLPVPVQIEAVSGNDQVGAPATTLPQPLRVRLIGREGQPLRGLWIQWEVVGDSGTAEPRNGFTDEEGIAEATWVLGPASGPQQVKVLVGGGAPMIFEATAANP